jgi:hypothetical protein
MIKDIKHASDQLGAVFKSSIQTQAERFTGSDQRDYEALLAGLRSHVLAQLTQFFEQRRARKEGTFEEHIDAFDAGGTDIRERMHRLKEKIERGFLALKKKEQIKTELQEHMMDAFFMNKQTKKIFLYIKKYAVHKQNKRKNLDEMREKFRRQMLKKSFLPWRALGYKEGYENTIRGSAESDLNSIHTQYKGIISLLKAKISETDDLIKIKKAAKGEFAYALNRDLLKTISNLSLEVISLNQVVLKDQNQDRQQTAAFMDEINRLLQSKFDKINEYRRDMRGEEEGDESDSRPKQKPRISFA